MTWPELVRQVEQLAGLIKRGGIQPDALVAIARGGFVPARLLANHFAGVELASIGIGYDNSAKTVPRLRHAPDRAERWGTLVIVEDCLESGRSLRLAAGYFETSAERVVTAALWSTPGTEFAAEFSLGELPKPPRFPWEAKR